MSKRRLSIGAAVLAALGLVLLAVACGDDDPDIVFMAGFKPQANLPFVAAYVAQEKGFFRDQGLEVEIQHAPTGGSSTHLVAGNVDVTTADSTAVLKRISDPGLPIVAIALFGQRGQQAFLALADSGIETPKDWEGKTFGYKGSVPPDYLAILKANDVDRSRVKEVRVGFDPRILTEGKVDILAAFKSNEPDTVRKLGFELKIWDPADYGVPSMGLTYITHQDLVEKEPDKVERFLKATLRGLQYALENREETLDIVMKFAPDEERAHQAFMLDTELADAVNLLTDERGLGWMTGEQWRALYEHLVEFEALPKPFDPQKAYTDRFLKAVYDGNKLRWP